MTRRCVLCEQRDTHLGYACWDCINSLLGVLRELGEYHSALYSLTQPARRGAGRSRPGYASRSPAADDVLVALDPRSLPGDVDQDGDAITRRPDDAGTWVRSITGAITGIAEWIAAERGYTKPVGWGYIRESLPWCAQHTVIDSNGDPQPCIDDIASDLRELHRQARALCHDQPPGPLGRCLLVDCAGTVYVRYDHDGRPDGGRCRRCSRVYDGLDLVRLGVAQEAS